MEPIIRISQVWLKDLQKVLAPGEEIQVAIPIGKVDLESGRVPRATDRDYLMLTDKRLIEVKGRYFINKTGCSHYPRRLVTAAESRNFLMGSTLKIAFRDERKENEEVMVEFSNCGKREADAIVEILDRQLYNRFCPSCRRLLDQDSTFCPNCFTVLKHLCSTCGKKLEPESDTCPHCGKAKAKPTT
ncbi:MAG TPA: zinc ribbon domain-containing protein [bacterium]|nr:zinc ribbon domain-containing protein [bacterium]